MRILHADDHPIFRTGLRYVLEDLDEQVDILEAHDIQDSLAILNSLPPVDLIVLDLCMPGMEGLKGYQQVAQTAPSCPVVIVSASEDYIDVHRVREAGAQGYLPKSASRDVLLQGLRAVLSGEDYFPVHLLTPVITPQAIPRLSQRQLDVLQLLSKGLSNKLIAEALNLSETTIKTHVRGILKALDVRTRTQAVMKGQTLKLL